jgi:hypothetical protein
MMDIFDPILFTILVFGVYTSYTDIKYGKIKNIAILLLLISGIFLNIFYTRTLSNPSLSSSSIFIQTIINFLIALGFSFLIFISSLWSPGDAKLFLGFALLIPITFYKYPHFIQFPSISILINTFIPVAIFYTIFSFLSTDRKKLWEIIKETLTVKSLSETLVLLFVFSFIVQLILNYLGIKLIFFLQIFIMFVLIETFRRLSEKYMRIFSYMAATLRIIFFYNSILTISFLYNFFYLVIIFQILKIVMNVVELSSSISVKIKDLKPGMIFEEHVIKQKGRYVKTSTSLISVLGFFKNIKDGFLSEVDWALTKEDVKRFQSLAKEKKLDFDEIKVVRSVPFAQFMLIGVLITYFLQGSFLFYLPFR